VPFLAPFSAVVVLHVLWLLSSGSKARLYLFFRHPPKFGNRAAGFACVFDVSTNDRLRHGGICTARFRLDASLRDAVC